MPLTKLSVIHVQGLYAAMDRAKKSAETIRLAHAVLRRALKQAVRWRLVPYNVCVDVDRPRVAKADITPLDGEQVATLLRAAATDRLGAIFTVAIATGMRLGELFGLHWADVDLKAGAIMVKHTLTELSGQLFLTEPKTAKGRRRINLPTIAIDALEEHRKLMLDEGHGDVPWVFCDTQGGPLRRSHFHERTFKPLLEEAGLPAIRFHDLRHTSATLLLSAGVHPKVVQERLGHSQISVTLDTYSHVLPTLQLEAAGKLDAILRAGSIGDDPVIGHADNVSYPQLSTIVCLCVVHRHPPASFCVCPLDRGKLATYWLHSDPMAGLQFRCSRNETTTQAFAWSIVTKRRARGSNPQPHYWGTTFPAESKTLYV